ncbi:AAA family ATPase [Phaeobacter sp. C3_T13_0]|uniref:AAA family ATPase n=1 Tax=Phaeobacter cretensis TaxID=3342641 RepID=UPI0039BC77EC
MAKTFFYFVIRLGNQYFDLTKEVAVTDDAITSLDPGSAYQAFAYPKNAVNNAKPIFLLTHNFEFLKLLRN